MYTKYYQTDFTGFIRADGCLAFCHVETAQQKVNKGLTRDKLISLIYTLHKNVSCSYNNNRPVLSDENDINKPGIFVWDHEAVINHTLLFLNIKDLKIRYIGRKYMPWEEERGKISFGTNKGANELILQVRTINGGHFQRENYNPWEPGTKMIDLKSVRYYRWIT